jgi:hypothetical protein
MTWNISEETIIKAAGKAHRCDWCNQLIDCGASYHRFRWYDGSEAGTTKLHPECHAAWSLWCGECQSGDEWDVGGMRRGCVCDPAGDGCARCKPAPKTSTCNRSHCLP